MEEVRDVTDRPTSEVGDDVRDEASADDRVVDVPLNRRTLELLIDSAAATLAGYGDAIQSDAQHLSTNDVRGVNRISEELVDAAWSAAWLAVGIRRMRVALEEASDG